MEKNDKIIWDSGFGYDLGYYVGVDFCQPDNLQCEMVTGVVQKLNSYYKSEIIPYTEEQHKIVNKKYPMFNYKKF